MPASFQLRTAINNQHTGQNVLVPSWDGRCEIFPQQAYDPVASDDGALDEMLTRWGVPRDCKNPVLVNIEYTPDPNRTGPVPEGDYRDPRQDAAFRQYFVTALQRIRRARPDISMGAYVSSMAGMCGAARTADERARWSQLILEQQGLNNQLAPLIRELNWVGIAMYRRPRLYTDGTSFNYALRDSELVAEATRVVQRSNRNAVCVAVVSPFVGSQVTGVLPIDPHAIVLPALLAKATGWAGLLWWGNAANRDESDHLLAQVPWVERTMATIKPLLMRGNIAQVIPVADGVRLPGIRRHQGDAS